MGPGYYIVSNKHTDGLVRTFWKADGNGYTINLDEAGIYSFSEIKRYGYPIISKENLKDRGKHDTFAISIEDVELLGKRMTCIFN